MPEENEDLKNEQIRISWETSFSNLLSADNRTRGQAIKEATQPLKTAIDSKDCDSGFKFILAVEAFAATIENDNKRLRFFNFFSKLFHEFLPVIRTKFENSPSVTLASDIWRLLKTYWGRKWSKNERFLLEGHIHEYLAEHTNPIASAIEFESSRAAFQRGQALDDAERVAQKKHNVVLNSPVLQIKKISLPKNLSQMIQVEFDKKLSQWQTFTSDEKFFALVNDYFELRPEEISDDNLPYTLIDTLESLGAITTQQITRDGRTSQNCVPSSRLQRNYAVDLTFQNFTLERLSHFITEWLNVTETFTGNDGILNTTMTYQRVLNSLHEYTNFPDTISEGIDWGMQLYLQKYYRPALALWLPLFESLLRDALFSKGEWIINPKEVKGPEEYLGLDNLLKRAEKYYMPQTVLFWKRWFSNDEGLGLNLRNNHCHGIMHNEEYCEWIATGTILSFFFLAQSKS